MLAANSKSAGMYSPGTGRTAGGAGGSSPEAGGWEIRPGGMLVQKRHSDSVQNPAPVSAIKVRVTHGSSCHEIKISPQASFGELKKTLAGPTGLSPLDQKLKYREEERDSKSYRDVSGIKDGSRIVLAEDVASRGRGFVQSLKNPKNGKGAKEIAEISLEIDVLAKKVANVELEICGGKRVEETLLLNLIELLMTQLIKLDGVLADGDVKLRRRMQVKRVQKYIETLDMLKIRNAMTESRAGDAVPLQRRSNKSSIAPIPKPKPQIPRDHRQRVPTCKMPRPVIITTKWETF